MQYLFQHKNKKYLSFINLDQLCVYLGDQLSSLYTYCQTTVY